jgi:ABC-2 type transport system ATP-binding protein
MHKHDGGHATGLHAGHHGPVLEIRGVSKTFGKFKAVDSMDLSVAKGDIFGFLGPNGAGKTTTIKLVLDVLRPTAGSIQLFGKSNRLTEKTHSHIGYLSGDMVLDDDLTGRQYLDFVARTYGKDYQTQIKVLAEQLQADLSVKIGKYSRGNKQKIGLIAAMMHSPLLLILDEPSSGFDPLMQEVFIRLAEDYNKAGGTIFMSSHSLAEVQRLCNRVAFIREGKLVGVSDTDELGRSSAKQVRVSASPETLAAVRKAAETLKGLELKDSSEKILKYSYNGPAQPLLKLFAAYPLQDLTIEEPELEEIFMSYYEGGGAKPREDTKS